jgi:anti-sigma factor RsiW
VYSKDQRRPVEVAADQEQQLVTWLSKRLGTEVHAPRLASVGYELVGGRLLPGDSGPVAQFMYQDSAGQRLTLYVTHEAPQPTGRDTAFRFGKAGAVNVFYWVDRGFGYALSGAIERPELMRVSQEVYRQLTTG